MNSTGMETFIENHTVVYPYQKYSFGIIIYCDYFLFVFFISYFKDLAICGGDLS